MRARETTATAPQRQRVLARFLDASRLSVALGAALLSAACFPPGEGLDPDPEVFNFPVGLALSEGGSRLYVVNSDFDLRFNGGVVQVLDTDVILEHLPQSCETDADCRGAASCDAADDRIGYCRSGDGSMCGELGEQTVVEQLSHPGPCAALPLGERGLLMERAVIAPFVADVRYVPGAGERPARLLMPVRGDATLHWADVENDVDGGGPVLDCGQGQGLTCDADHRRGDERDEAAPGGDGLPTEPFGIAVSDDGRTIFVGHQSQGAVSVFDNGRRGPALQTVLEGLPSNPMGLGAVPIPEAAERFDLDYTQGVLVTYRLSGRVEPAVELLRYFDEDQAAPGRPYLHRAGSGVISTNSSGADTRGIAVDGARRSACESGCGCADDEAADVGDCYDCLMDCAAVPLNVFITNRSPDSLVTGATRNTLGQLPRDDVPDFSEAEPMRGAPARLLATKVIDENGEAVPRVLVLAFDAQLMYIYDPQRGEIETHTKTGPGPQSVTVDETRALAYVAHFTDSYVGVVDLDKRHPTYGQVILSVGQPQPPRSSK